MRSPGEHEAEGVATRYFDAVKDGDYNVALTLYSPEFFRQTPADRWLSALKQMRLKLGDLQSHELRQWNVQQYVGTGPSGTYYRLTYKVTYSEYPADETLVLFRSLSGGEIKIVGHHINSTAFLN